MSHTFFEIAQIQAAGVVLATLDMIEVPYLFNPNGMICLEVVRT